MDNEEPGLSLSTVHPQASIASHLRTHTRRLATGSRGFTLLETLAGFLILTLIVTTALGIFYDRERRLRAANEMILVWQALANESEVERRIPFGDARLAPDLTRTFISDTGIVAPLSSVAAVVAVEKVSDDMKLVRMTIRWNGGVRAATLTLVRTNTGGGALW
jgi:Tfp pilus assembly protein PilV